LDASGCPEGADLAVRKFKPIFRRTVHGLGAGLEVCGQSGDFQPFYWNSNGTTSGSWLVNGSMPSELMQPVDHGALRFGNELLVNIERRRR
jgi:hypothetical protein